MAEVNLKEILFSEMNFEENEYEKKRKSKNASEKEIVIQFNRFQTIFEIIKKAGLEYEYAIWKSIR